MECRYEEFGEFVVELAGRVFKEEEEVVEKSDERKREDV